MNKETRAKARKLLSELAELQTKVYRIENPSQRDDTCRFDGWHSDIPEWAIRLLKYKSLVKMVTLIQNKQELLDLASVAGATSAAAAIEMHEKIQQDEADVNRLQMRLEGLEMADRADVIRHCQELEKYIGGELLKELRDSAVVQLSGKMREIERELTSL